MNSLESIRLSLVSKIMTLSSFFGVLAFFFVATDKLDKYYEPLPDIFEHIAVKAIIVFIVFGLLSRLSLFLACTVFDDGGTMEAREIKPIESIALPTYIGLFVIALEISGSLELDRSIAVLAMLLILWGLFERVFYFNPIWLFFGYRFYEAKDEKGNTFTLVSKSKNLKGAHSFNNLRKINEYTYLD